MAARFPTTRWSRVVRALDPADPGARAALEDLCRDYWFPLYAFARRRELSPSEAEDLVQGFLADLLERGDLAGVDRSKGRFRSFLFARLRPALQGDALAPSYATIGAEVGMSAGAVRVAAHRLRARYRELLREEVGRTTDEPAHIDEEIAELMQALSGR